MKLHYFGLIFILTLFNCKKDANTGEENFAYLGGEIINPYTNFVVLLKADKLIDTIKLDNKNRFIYKLNNLEPGLYSFYNGGEMQVVLLEPRDSIIFRLNTLEFDESLVFTGNGDKKNNYLITEFLENEIQENKIFKLCQLKPDTYEKRIDSIKDFKLKKFNEHKVKYGASELFEKLALANIDFSYYSSKEVYPFVHHGGNKSDIIKSLPSNFYDYRKEINYNDTFLKDIHYYNSFLRYSVNNLSLKNHLHHHANESFNWNSLCYNLDRLRLIDSLVKNKTIKNDLLYHFTTKYLFKSSDHEGNTKILNSFLQKSSNENDKTAIKRYEASLNNLKAGALLPDIKLVDYNNNEFSINTLIHTPTVICFWSHAYYDHFKESHYKLNELKAKYPEVTFIVVNVDESNTENPKQSLRKNRFATTNEYQFKTPKEAMETLALQPITKTIIVDKNKKIVYNNSNIFSRVFEEQLLGAINRK